MNSSTWGQSYVNMGAQGEIGERTVKGRQVLGALESYERKKCKHGGKTGNKK